MWSLVEQHLWNHRDDDELDDNRDEEAGELQIRDRKSSICAYANIGIETSRCFVTATIS